MTAAHANHPTSAELTALAVGKLSGADAGPVAAHLEGCPDCAPLECLVAVKNAVLLPKSRVFSHLRQQG
jgi:hypothetical protein